MIEFERYPHIKDLMNYYVEDLQRKDIKEIMQLGVQSEEDATAFARFVWQMAGKMNLDEENEIVVLGAIDNSDMFPDLNYEISLYLRERGFYAVWERISNEEIDEDNKSREK